MFVSVPLTILWLVAIIVFALIEGLTPSALVSIWFSIGSLAALIVSFFTPSFWIQLFVFLIVSSICFALLRPLAKKYFTPKTEHTNADGLVGRQAVVTETIDNLAGAGQVSLRGQIWTARAQDNTPIEAGCKVTVLRIEGVKVIVSPVED